MNFISLRKEYEIEINSNPLYRAFEFHNFLPRRQKFIIGLSSYTNFSLKNLKSSRFSDPPLRAHDKRLSIWSNSTDFFQVTNTININIIHNFLLCSYKHLKLKDSELIRRTYLFCSGIHIYTSCLSNWESCFLNY